MKLDKEFKNEIDEGFKEGDYIGRRLFLRTLLIVVIISILSISGEIVYKKIKVDQDRQIFKQSVTYNESAASFLADSYKQYQEAETDKEKNAIMNYVTMKYPNLDTDNIENVTLKQFYNKCFVH